MGRAGAACLALLLLPLVCAVPYGEIRALVEMFNATGGPQWTAAAGWPSGDPCSSTLPVRVPHCRRRCSRVAVARGGPRFCVHQRVAIAGVRVSGAAVARARINGGWLCVCRLQWLGVTCSLDEYGQPHISELYAPVALLALMHVLLHVPVLVRPSRLCVAVRACHCVHQRSVEQQPRGHVARERREPREPQAPCAH
jgi:hypothetical protein